jgi:hypothetical protein
VLGAIVYDLSTMQYRDSHGTPLGHRIGQRTRQVPGRHSSEEGRARKESEIKVRDSDLRTHHTNQRK